MSYQVQLTNGNVIAVVPDTQLVSTYGGLNLIGKFYPGFGTVFNDNLVHMTEHFASIFGTEHNSNPLVLLPVVLLPQLIHKKVMNGMTV
jgi:hypothetical protein